jgi:hypothetical protein
MQHWLRVIPILNPSSPHLQSAIHCRLSVWSGNSSRNVTQMGDRGVTPIAFRCAVFDKRRYNYAPNVLHPGAVMAAQFALGPELLLSNAARELFEHRQSAARKTFSPSRKFPQQRRWTASVSFTLLASLFLLTSTASAIGAAPGSTSKQANASSTGSSQSENDVRDLELGKPIERELAGGQHHAYQVSLESGQFLHVVVEPHGIAVTVPVSGPDGKPMMTLAAPAGSSEPLYLVAKEQGTYRIEIRSPEGAAAGSCRIELEGLWVATSRDNNVALAQSVLAEAKQLYEKGTAASKRESIAKDEESLALWRTAGDARGEGGALRALGL